MSNGETDRRARRDEAAADADAAAALGAPRHARGGRGARRAQRHHGDRRRRGRRRGRRRLRARALRAREVRRRPRGRHARRARATTSSGSRGRRARCAADRCSPASWARARRTVGRLLARAPRTPFADADDEIERRAGEPVRAIFEQRGEAAFRALEERRPASALIARDDAPVIALGRRRAAPRRGARAGARPRVLSPWLDVPFDVSPGSASGADATARPLARDRDALRALHAERAPRYVAVADALLAAGSAQPDALAGAIAPAVWTRRGLGRELDAQLAGRRSIGRRPALAGRVAGSFRARIELDGGEDAKSPAALERLWRSLAAAEARALPPCSSARAAAP